MTFWVFFVFFLKIHSFGREGMAAGPVLGTKVFTHLQEREGEGKKKKKERHKWAL